MSLYDLNKDMLIMLIESIKIKEAEILKEVCVLHGLEVYDKPDYRKMSKEKLIETVCRLEEKYHNDAEYYCTILSTNLEIEKIYMCQNPICYKYSLLHKLYICFVCHITYCEEHNENKIFAHICYKCDRERKF